MKRKNFCDFGKKVADICEKTGVEKQSELADVLGFSRPFTSEILRGNKPPSKEFIRQLEKKFDLPEGKVKEFLVLSYHQ